MNNDRIKDYISQSNTFSLELPKVKTCEDILLIVIGGTSWKVGKSSPEGKLEILGIGKVGKLKSGSELLGLLKKLREKFDPNCTQILLNLAFSMKIVDHKKVLYKKSKGHNIDDIINIPIEDYFSRGIGIDVKVFNDAYVLSANSDHNHSISVIVGTGFNIAFKYNGLLYNTEIGKFNNFDIPEKYSHIKNFEDKDYMEYIVGGGYFKRNLEYLLSNEQYDTIKSCEFYEINDSEINQVIDRHYQTSAYYCSLCLAEIIRFIDTEDVIYVQTEGSIINKSLHYKESIINNLKKFGIKNKIHFIYTEKSYFMGMINMIKHE